MSTSYSLNNFLGLFLASGIIAKIILMMLFFSSVLCWAIIFMKWREIKRISTQDMIFQHVFSSGKTLAELTHTAEHLHFSALAQVFTFCMFEIKACEGHQNMTLPLKIENTTRALQREILFQLALLEKGTPYLASIASTAPFIGLFGTVWGIMNAFQSIAVHQNADLSVVAPGISEALITTAIGIGVAIPAVLGYNFCATKTRALSVRLECFSQDFLNFLHKNFWE